MSLKDYQTKIDSIVGARSKPYFEPLSQLAFVVEEVGELARLLNHMYGDKPKKITEAKQDLAGELADILFGVICIANREGVDLDKALGKVITKSQIRDRNRFK